MGTTMQRLCIHEIVGFVLQQILLINFYNKINHEKNCPLKCLCHAFNGTTTLYHQTITHIAIHESPALSYGVAGCRCVSVATVLHVLCVSVHPRVSYRNPLPQSNCNFSRVVR